MSKKAYNGQDSAQASRGHRHFPLVVSAATESHSCVFDIATASPPFLLGIVSAGWKDGKGIRTWAW